MPVAHEQEWDVVVIGSGAGGGTLAARLAEQGLRVFLLEAGGDAPTEGASGMPEDHDVPAFHPFASENPAMRWDFRVRHYADPAQQALDWKSKDDSVLYPRAATLGGCTAHNAMIFVLPHDSDWDGIAALTGDASWRAIDVTGGLTYAWDADSTYVRNPPYFDGITKTPVPITNIVGARDQWAAELRIFDASIRGSRWGLMGSFTMVEGSEPYRVAGPDNGTSRADFNAFSYRRVGDRLAATYALTPLSRVFLGALAELVHADLPGAPLAAKPRIKPGSVLVREWAGRPQRVMAMDDGFAWEGKTYRSLSEVARAIT